MKLTRAISGKTSRISCGVCRLSDFQQGRRRFFLSHATTASLAGLLESDASIVRP
jgi:hypothetical protein